MATTINPVTGVIYVPKADTTLVDIGPPEIRALDTNAWRLELRALEDDDDNRWAQRTHDHNKDVDIGGGVVLADVLLILDPYTVTFEDGQYAVNLTGTNNNILLKNNKNQVSVNPGNSAGLVVVPGAVGAAEIWEYLINGGSEEAQEVMATILLRASLAAFKE
jgi:hypothetical protein